MIPLFYPPYFNINEALTEIEDTLKSKWLGQGPKVDFFEKVFSDKFNFKYCVMVNSGTSALHIAYILSNIKKDSEVLVPVLTCSATNHPLKWLGAKIVFVDINPNTLTIDINDFRRKITKKSIAVIPVHLGGLVCNIEEIKFYAKENNLTIIEDACQALGALNVGYGNFCCFSFQAIKNLTTADGGMLICNNEENYKKARRLRWFDIDRENRIKNNWNPWDNRGIISDQENQGYKYQATDIDASLGLIGLKYFDSNQKHRKKLVQLYRILLKDSNKITLLEEHDNSNWLFMVLVNEDRNKLAGKLLNAGVETNIGHIRNDILKVFGGKRKNLKNMNYIEKKYLCLPLNTKITEKDIEYICGIIND
ncbi:MAG: DegT/DnrJ/EryC1/StrS family aminotransferase [Asgard group archaeon]|nr:DegT/DnrJ/EryC1/StrS family aminotransferase [Asgard group archaeon]